MFSSQSCLQLAPGYLDGDWLLEAEGKWGFRPQVDISLAGKVGDCSSSTSANWAADESAFASARHCANQCATAGAACNPGEVTLFVVAASLQTLSGAQVEGLAVDLNSIKDQAKLRPAHEVS